MPYEHRVTPTMYSDRHFCLNDMFQRADVPLALRTDEEECRRDVSLDEHVDNGFSCLRARAIVKRQGDVAGA